MKNTVKQTRYNLIEFTNSLAKQVISSLARFKLRTINIARCMNSFAAVLFCAVIMLGSSLTAHATSFTETVPNGNGAIPNT